MAVLISDITTKVRYLLGDIALSTTDVFQYSTSDIFTLSEENPISIESAFKNDVEINTSDISFDIATGKVTINSSMLSGDNIEIKYTHYPNFSDTEIESYIRAALIHISINNYKNFIEESDYIFPEPDDREKNLISIVTGLLIEPDNKTIRMPDFSMGSSKDLPTHDKVSKYIAIFKKNSHGKFSTL